MDRSGENCPPFGAGHPQGFYTSNFAAGPSPPHHHQATGFYYNSQITAGPPPPPSPRFQFGIPGDFGPNPIPSGQYQEHVLPSGPIFPMAGMSNDGSTNSIMADLQHFFSSPAIPGEVSYDIVGDIPDDWAVNINQGVDDMGDLAFPQMALPVQEKKANTSNFDRLEEKTLSKIFDYVGAKWNGLMPNMIIALRQSPVAYKHVLQHFINTCRFVLSPGNNWSLAGMPTQVIGRIKNLELAVCVCNLTDGDNTWIQPDDTWSPKKNGLSSVETVTIYPSNIANHLQHISRLAPENIIHQCAKNEQCLMAFLRRFPIFLRPFTNLRKTVIYNCITPWVRVNQVGDACKQLSHVRWLTTRQIGFESTLKNKVDRRVGQVAGQKWVWLVEEGKRGMNWSKMWKQIIPYHMYDLGDMIDWSACDEDNACKTQ